MPVGHRSRRASINDAYIRFDIPGIKYAGAYLQRLSWAVIGRKTILLGGGVFNGNAADIRVRSHYHAIKAGGIITVN
eukprot:6189411-Pleurochrysis_carterae.AAC.1